VYTTEKFIPFPILAEMLKKPTINNIANLNGEIKNIQKTNFLFRQMKQLKVCLPDNWRSYKKPDTTNQELEYNFKPIYD